MTDWTAADLPAFTGRTVIVTGASSGLGLITARELARVGAHDVLAVRNTAKGDDAAAGLAGSVEVRKLDLQELDSVREFAERAPTVSSMFHRRAKIDLNDVNWQHRRYNTWFAYAQSKLANLLFTSELQRRLDQAESPVRALAAHPGYSATNLQSHSAGRFSTAFLAAGDRLVATDADFGARQSLFAVSQDLPGNTYVGPRFGFYGRTQPVGRSRAARQTGTAT